MLLSYSSLKTRNLKYIAVKSLCVLCASAVYFKKYLNQQRSSKVSRLFLIQVNLDHAFNHGMEEKGDRNYCIGSNQQTTFQPVRFAIRTN